MDNFKFITNISNPCGDGPTLEEYAEKVLKEAAGVAAPDGDDGKPDKEKGQVISDKGEAGEGFQDGESVKGPDVKKKTSEQESEVKEAAGKAKAEDCEGMQISLDASEEFQKGESVDGSKVTAKEKKTEAKGKAEVKEAKKEEKEKEEEEEEKEAGIKAKVKEAKKKEDEKKKASTNDPNWVKISNLNPKEKKMLRQYWLTQYPRAYVDAMIQDR